jgi:hypothetical protein
MSGSDQMTEDTWHVQVEDGDVKVWTLDQLDAAFKAGIVDESTYVLETGTTEWMTLGTLLGGDEPEAPAAVPAMAAAAPLAQVRAPVVEYAPVTMSEPPLSFSPMSTAPVMADLDDLDNPAAFRSSKKRPLAIGFGVALVAAGVAAFAFTHGHAADTSAEVAAAAPPPAPPPVVEAPKVDDPAIIASPGARLSDETRKKLADIDHAREAKLDAQQKARAASAPHHGGHRAAKEKTPFHSGGDKYDPLNAKL